jgi:hypothetical protein
VHVMYDVKGQSTSQSTYIDVRFWTYGAFSIGSIPKWMEVVTTVSNVSVI